MFSCCSHSDTSKDPANADVSVDQKTQSQEEGRSCSTDGSCSCGSDHKKHDADNESGHTCSHC